MRAPAKLLYWAVALPAGLAIVVFTVVNWREVTVSLAPFPWALDLPLSLVVGVAILAGLVVGVTLVWLGGQGARRVSAGRRRRIRELERALAEAEARVAQARREAVTATLPRDAA